DPDGVQQKEPAASPALSCVRPTRVVSSTSEEEEAFTEKFLKINCKYITNGKGTVNGVLLVTPNNIMFDPHKMDPLVQENGCEEYGIMCPMEEVMSAALYKEIVDSKIKDSLTMDVEHQSGRELGHAKKAARSNTDEMESRVRDTGNDSASTAPRSTEESLSEDVFTESELSPIREEQERNVPLAKPTQDSEIEVEELRKLWKTHTMQQARQQREHLQHDSRKEASQKSMAVGDGQVE
ncbi:PREDICTED: oxidation resistance protein 1-like, partial [Tinamus guttatus]|uniref:oxidation resistance protein 1-like n=1 Tax=Tinamus guttatus TaxID=94827 RepID=UPI00052F09F9